MSIQSEITRIQNSVSGQSDLLDMIIAALAGKAAGGGGNTGEGAGSSGEAATLFIGHNFPTSEMGNDGDSFLRIGIEV